MSNVVNEVVNSKITIVDLPDDCLYEICKYHTFFDLMTIGDTNQRLRKITSKVLANKRTLDLMCYPFKDPDDYDGKRFLGATQRALKLYGHQIEKMKYILLERPAADHIFSLIVKYCSGTLTDLTLGDISGDESSDTMKLLLPIFKHLKSLTLENYDLWLTDHLELILPNCFKLEKLTMDVLKRCSGSLRHIFEIDIMKLLRNLKIPLKELSLNRSENSWDGDIAVTSLSPIFQQKQLRVFQMINFQGEKIDTNIISDNLPALEVLSITIDDPMNFEPLLKLHRLKRLKLCVTNNLVNEFGNFMNSLKIHSRLELLSLHFKRTVRVPWMEWDIAIKKMLNSVSMHTSLRSLEFKFDSLLEDKLQCAAKLPNLNHFTFTYDDLFDIPGWKVERKKVRLSILKFLSEVPTLQTLNMTFVENIWNMRFFEDILKIRCTQDRPAMLHIYDCLDPYEFCDKYQKRYKVMKSNFVKVIPKFERLD